MAAVSADRDLLFGLMALQNGLIDQVQLVAAFQAWTRDKARSLAEHLAALDPDKRAGVEAMVDPPTASSREVKKSLVRLTTAEAREEIDSPPMTERRIKKPWVERNRLAIGLAVLELARSELYIF